MSEFIFMLTRNDVTLSDARSIYASIAGSGLRHIGCKDVGLPQDELKAFMDEIRANGHTSYLEVVSETEQAIRMVMKEQEPVELSPQNAYIRRLQHQMAERANIVSRSRGREPYRRVRLYPEEARTAWR